MDDGPGTAGIPSVHSIVMRLLKDDEPDSQSGVLAFNCEASDCESGNFNAQPRQQPHRPSQGAADMAVRDASNTAKFGHEGGRFGRPASAASKTIYGDETGGANQGGSATASTESATTTTDIDGVVSGNCEEGSEIAQHLTEMAEQGTDLAVTADVRAHGNMEDGQTLRSKMANPAAATAAATGVAAPAAAAGGVPSAPAAVPSRAAERSCSSPVIPRFGEWDAAAADVPLTDSLADAHATAMAPSTARPMAPYSSDDEHKAKDERGKENERKGDASGPENGAETSTDGDGLHRKDAAAAVHLPQKRPDGRDYRLAAENGGYSALFEQARRYDGQSAV